MADEQQAKQRMSIWARVAAALMLYVLSVGPVMWSYYALPPVWKDRMEVAVGTLYYPLAIACNYSGLHDWLEWYAGLF